MLELKRSSHLDNEARLYETRRQGWRRFLMRLAKHMWTGMGYALKENRCKTKLSVMFREPFSFAHRQFQREQGLLVVTMAPYTHKETIKDWYKHTAPTRVLVVDDDRAIRETVRLILEDEGYEVVEASNGVEALRILRESPTPLVVVLDMMMPKLDGAGALATVAEDPSLEQRHAFTLVTADTQTTTHFFDQLLTRLDVPVIHKPFDIDTLLTMVERLSERLAHRERHEAVYYNYDAESPFEMEQRYSQK